MTDSYLNLVDPKVGTPDGTDEYVINLGPQHPATHGVLRLIVKLDGESVRETVAVPGYLHRSIEKIFENRNYPQGVVYTDRIDYASAMSCNLAHSLAVERLLGIADQVPPRAQWLRMIFVELQRIASHLLWYGAFGGDLGALTPFLYGLRERERILDLFEMTCGQRLTYHYIRIGGVSQDIPEDFVPLCRKFLDEFPTHLRQYEDLLSGNPIFLERTRGVGVIPPEAGVSWGVCGPSLRGSGVSCDVRRQQPYLYYDQVKWEEPLQTAGDCLARYRVRMDELAQSASIVRQCLDRLEPGPVKMKLYPFLKVPEGAEVYSRIESSRGEMGVYMVGNGTVKPARVKYRTASFANLAMLDVLTRGLKVADIMAVLGSLDIIIPEVDR